jgi:hypothetical protein
MEWKRGLGILRGLRHKEPAARACCPWPPTVGVSVGEETCEASSIHTGASQGGPICTHTSKRAQRSYLQRQRQLAGIVTSINHTYILPELRCREPLEGTLAGPRVYQLVGKLCVKRCRRQMDMCEVY